MIPGLAPVPGTIYVFRMKIPVAILGLALCSSALRADTAVAPKPADPKTAVPAVSTTKPAVTPDAKAKAAADAKKKKEEAMGVIKGTEIKRANGTYLGLEVINSNFVLSFYDKKKKPAAVDVTRATARWPNPRGPGDFRTVLNGGGASLVGAKPVIPPFSFNVYLTLLQGEGDDAKAVESFVVQFRG